MKQRAIRSLYWAGVIAPVWLPLGVWAVAGFYPGYSHIHQAMSELGAIGSPVHTLSPIINNYPLGTLFTLFGCGIIGTFHSSKPARISGLLIVIHGLGSIAAGFFPCDVGCSLDSSLPSQGIHNLAGVVMFFSLLFSSLIWTVLAKRLLDNRVFGGFSLLCSLLAVALLWLLAGAVESGVGFGLYQRLGYGVQVLWVLVFALLLLSRPERKIGPPTDAPS